MSNALEEMDHTPQRWQPLRRQLSEMPEGQLRSFLAERLRLTAENLMEMALAIREFDRRGIDLSELRISLLVYLRRIAYGQTLPEVVAMLAGRRELLQRVAFLPLPEQQRCVDGEGLTVVIRQLPGGEMEIRQRSLLDLEPMEIRQVFGPGGLRTQLQQAVWLKSRCLRLSQPTLERPTYTIEKNQLIVNRPTRLSRREITRILAAM